MLKKKMLSNLKGRESHYIDPGIFKKILIQATILPIALSLFLSVLFIQQVFTILKENHKVRHSDEVLNYAGEAVKLVLDSETGFRGFIITGNDEYLEPWEHARKQFYVTIDQLILFVKDTPQQVQELHNIKKLYQSWNAKAVGTLEYREKFNRTSPDSLIKGRKAMMEEMRKSFDGFIKRERDLRNKRWDNAEQTSREAIFIIIALGVVLGLTLAAMSIIQLKRISQKYNEAFESLSSATDHLEETVAQRTYELLSVNKELEAFSYSVSHDLRAPLRGIDGFSQILVEEYSHKLDGEAIKYLGFIRAGVQKMGVLIDDLINLSRLTRTEFKKEDIDLSELSLEIINEFKFEYPQRNLKFTNFPSLILNIDKGLMRVALQNLISNAWKYSSTKDITIIELGVTIKDGLPTYFIKDNGVGFDMRYYDKLFQPFQRLHPKDKFDGTGIGLATVARIIRRHNGTIWGESELEVGSTFYFTVES